MLASTLGSPNLFQGDKVVTNEVSKSGVAFCITSWVSEASAYLQLEDEGETLRSTGEMTRLRLAETP